MRYSRWYAFDTEFPCSEQVQLCKPNASMTSWDFAQAVLNNMSCFPLPVPDMPAGGIHLAVLGNKLNTLSPLNYPDATHNMVEPAKHFACCLQTCLFLKCQISFQNLSLVRCCT